MAPLRVVYLWDADYPWDVRTEKVCLTLKAAGHEVHIVARNGLRAPVEEDLPEGRVHRMAPWRWAGAGLDRFLGFPAFFNPRWLELLRGTTRKTRADLIIARDLPLCPVAIWIGRLEGVPVLFDMAENYPALLEDSWTTGRQRPADYFVRNVAAARLVERYCLPRLTRILVVVEESRDRLITMGVSVDRIHVVSNTPSLHRLARVPARRSGPEGAPIELVYLGVMEVARGVGLLIEAMHRLQDVEPPVRLRLIGAGRDLDLFREQARRLEILDRKVEFTGFLPYSDALDLVARADIGVVPHQANEWANTSIPNKLFDYMAAGLPVLSSDAIPCARIVRETGCGYVFRAQDVQSLADGIRSLSDPAVRHERGTSGRQAIYDRYNWEADSTVLLEAVSAAAASPRSARRR